LATKALENRKKRAAVDSNSESDSDSDDGIDTSKFGTVNNNYGIVNITTKVQKKAKKAKI
jgi:hypothetical protein